MGKLVKLTQDANTALYPITVSEVVGYKNTTVYERLKAIQSAITYLYPLINKYVDEHPNGQGGSCNFNNDGSFNFTNINSVTNELYTYNDSILTGWTSAGYSGIGTTFATSYNGPISDAIRTTQKPNGFSGFTSYGYNFIKNLPYAIVSQMLNHLSGGTAAGHVYREVAFFELKGVSAVSTGQTIWGNPLIEIAPYTTLGVQGETRKQYSEITIITGKTNPTFVLRAGKGVGLMSGSLNANEAFRNVLEMQKDNFGYHRAVMFRDGDTVGATVDGETWYVYTGCTAANMPKLTSEKSVICNITVGASTYVIGNADEAHVNVFTFNEGTNVQQLVKNIKFFEPSTGKTISGNDYTSNGNYNFVDINSRYNQLSFYEDSDFNVSGIGTNYTTSFNGAISDAIRTTLTPNGLSGITNYGTLDQISGNPYMVLSKMLNYLSGGTNTGNYFHEIAFFELKGVQKATLTAATGNPLIVISPIPSFGAQSQQRFRFSEISILTGKTNPTFVFRAGKGSGKMSGELSSYEAFRNVLEMIPDSTGYHKAVMFRDNDTLGATVDGETWYVYTGCTAANRTALQYGGTYTWSDSSTYCNIIPGCSSSIGTANEAHVNVFKFAEGTNVQQLVKNMNFFK